MIVRKCKILTKTDGAESNKPEAPAQKRRALPLKGKCCAGSQCKRTNLAVPASDPNCLVCQQAMHNQCGRMEKAKNGLVCWLCITLGLKNKECSSLQTFFQEVLSKGGILQGILQPSRKISIRNTLTSV
jgi:hypothetical protein